MPPGDSPCLIGEELPEFPGAETVEAKVNEHVTVESEQTMTAKNREHLTPQR